MRILASSARRLATAAAFAATATVALTACGSSSGDQPIASISVPANAPTASSGSITLDPPYTKPSLTLTDDHGQSYNLVKQTAGKPLLLYFGYTHCPDVCPTTMADIAAATRTLPTAEQQRLQVVFVTTDPARDTPQRLNQWLGAIDPAFIGLTGDFSQIQAAAKSVGVGISAPVKHADGSYTVSHGAEVIVFSPKDDKAHLLYTSGVPESQYAQDLPKIVKGETP
ncbi:SCO family protein [Streptomyces sp. RB6PN25]|uniref:SCO family protein n=1 Tax=Streptomyces humicola TaxID=2953240 RepID=A0ABT1PWZ8_9ACTN|nr:SCO family protein [Streptomyces humicola]MCQ4081065.1 SCO family protein [Streptomyces humicola]